MENRHLKNTLSDEELQEKENLELEEKMRGKYLWLFVLNMAGVVVSFLTLVIYTNVVLRTLEKRFGLSSFQTGILSSSNDIMQICLVVFISYFGNKGHRPRIISFTAMFASISGFLMATPHFFLHDYEANQFTFDVTNNNATNDVSVMSKALNLYVNNSNSHDLCLATNHNDYQCSDRTSGSSWKNIHPAFYFFVVAQFISGVGSSALYTLSLAYIDENAPKNKLSLYLGFFIALFSLSPIIGMLLASFCLKLPENLFSGDKVNVDDPSFVGCWWLGYVIAATSLTIFTIPLNFFPKNLKEFIRSKRIGKRPLKEKEKIALNDESLGTQAKDFPKALLKLLRNKLYLLNLCQIVCGAYTIYGMYVNLVRYIEIHFLYSATLASIISGVASSAIGAVGSLIGGVFVSKLKLDTKQSMKLIIFTGVIYTTGVCVLLNLRCPQVQMDMSFTGDPYKSTVENSCNNACDCALDRKAYYPVCGSNGISYYSPCMAGCSSMEENNKSTVFKNCTCLREMADNNSITHEQNTNQSRLLYNYRTSGEGINFMEGTATPGYCTPKCHLFVAFTITLVLMTMCNSVTRVPSTMITFNIVDDDERSFALGFNSFVLNLLGFIPSPLLFGRLIDNSCILWQMTCSKTGACLLFDTARLRHSIYGSTMVVESLEILFYICIFFLIPRRPLHSAHKVLPEVILEVELKDTHMMEKKLKEHEVVNGTGRENTL